jgi:hypothetical protein
MKKKSKLKKLKKKMIKSSKLIDAAIEVYLVFQDAYTEEYFKKAKK